MLKPQFSKIVCKVISKILLSSAVFFQNCLFQEIFSRTLLECQSVWIQIRTDVLSVLIWVQTICKGYQQTTKVAACKEIVEHVDMCEVITYNRFLLLFQSFKEVINPDDLRHNK